MLLRTIACVNLQDKENCKSLVLQDKCNIEIFLSPANGISNVITLSGHLNGSLRQFSLHVNPYLTNFFVLKMSAFQVCCIYSSALQMTIS